MRATPHAPYVELPVALPLEEQPPHSEALSRFNANFKLHCDRMSRSGRGGRNLLSGNARSVFMRNRDCLPTGKELRWLRVRLVKNIMRENMEPCRPGLSLSGGSGSA